MCSLCHSCQAVPELRNRYLALKKRRGHKKAIIAIARMLLTAIYNMLKKNETYNPESTERATDHLHTARFLWKKPSSFYSGKAT